MASRDNRRKNLTAESEGRDIVPPVMWPESGSGFEADPSSPAGQLQGEARFLQGVSADGGRFRRAVLWVVLGVVAIAVFSFGVTFLLHLH